MLSIDRLRTLRPQANNTIGDVDGFLFKNSRAKAYTITDNDFMGGKAEFFMELTLLEGQYVAETNSYEFVVGTTVKGLRHSSNPNFAMYSRQFKHTVRIAAKTLESGNYKQVTNEIVEFCKENSPSIDMSIATPRLF